MTSQQTIMDPRVLALLAKLEQGEKKAESPKPVEEEIKPPTNIDEFMKCENLVRI